MDAMQALISDLGGLAATFELHAAGYARADIAAAVRARRILRVRQGWYAQPGTHPTLLATARVGGLATCGTGLGLHGLWRPRDHRIHVTCGAHDSRLRSPRDSRMRSNPLDPVRVHWRDAPSGASRLILEPLECLRDALSCFTTTELTIAADSLLHASAALRPAWPAFCASVEQRYRAALLLADGICESGLETQTWLRIRHLPTTVRRQVLIPPVGRVDFVLGERLVVEVDGEAFHTDSASFESDRRRDAQLAALGFVVLRFSYRQVTQDWQQVEAAIHGMLSRRLHLTR